MPPRCEAQQVLTQVKGTWTEDFARGTVPWVPLGPWVWKPHRGAELACSCLALAFRAGVVPGAPQCLPARGACGHGDATATSLVPSAGGERSPVSQGPDSVAQGEAGGARPRNPARRVPLTGEDLSHSLHGGEGPDPGNVTHDGQARASRSARAGLLLRCPARLWRHPLRSL